MTQVQDIEGPGRQRAPRAGDVLHEVRRQYGRLRSPRSPLAHARFVAENMLRHPSVWAANRPAWSELRRYERLVPPRALQRKYEEALGLIHDGGQGAELGDYLEFGVAFGTSMACFDRARKKRGLRDVRLFGFDSFEGLPEVAAEESGSTGWRRGRYCSDLALTTTLLELQGVDLSRVQLVKGWFESTLTEDTRLAHDLTRASVVMVDCDIYESSVQALEFCVPLIADRTVFVFDDWHSGDLAARGLGERKAFEEVIMADRQLTVEPLGGYHPRSEAFLVARRSGR